MGCCQSSTAASQNAGAGDMDGKSTCEEGFEVTNDPAAASKKDGKKSGASKKEASKKSGKKSATSKKTSKKSGASKKSAKKSAAASKKPEEKAIENPP
ncbi:hypothetical protein TYRP_010184 [Tyrophagus putrescentiae]|nr:hypothetical protein TYRP_010184 [Tyrophagus putrescentiae]